MTDGPLYRGYHLADLEVDQISWSDWSSDHLRDRTTRYPDVPDEVDLEPEWATEAALDPNRQLGITRENDLRVTGWSEHAPAASWSQRGGRVLRVVLKPREMEEGWWSGVTAAPASEKASKWYWRKRGSFGAP